MEFSLRQNPILFVLGVITKTKKTRIGLPLTIFLLTLMITGIMAEKRQDRKGDKQGKGRWNGQPKPQNGVLNIETDILETVERMNYGVSFSPIDGVYTPTEATYNLMLVMDVPQFKADNIPWKRCLRGLYFGCYSDMDMCEYLAPKYNGSAEVNQTCMLLNKFVSHLHKTRSNIGRDLLTRLRSYVELSADYVNNPAKRRKQRDIWSQNPNITPLLPCNQINTTTDHLSCMANSLEYTLMTETEKYQGHARHTREQRGSHKNRLSNNFIHELHELIDDLELAGTKAQSIDDLMYDMRQPHFNHKYNKHRQERGLLNFGGKLLGSLFGLVTEEEASDMQFALDALSKNQYKLADRLTTFEKRVVAVTNVTNYHLKRMNALMRRVDRKFTELFTEVNTGLLATTRFAALTSSMLLILMQDVERVSREMDQFLVGLRGLQRQELSIDLVPEDVLSEALENLQDHITEKYPTFSIAEPQPVYYYKQGKPAYSWDNGTLIIYLTVPLKSSNTAFRLYQVSGFSIPAVHNDSLYTRPVLENDVFGISHDEVNFLEMKQKDLESCTLAKTIRCELSTVVRDVYHKSCLLALFQNEKEDIQRLCEYRLEAQKQELSLQPISPGRVLVSNAATVSIQCPGRPAIVRPGCRSCIWSEACSCSLSATDDNAKSVTISPTLTGCQTEQWKQKVEFPVNMPALSRLIAPEKLKNISHDAYAESLSAIPKIDIDIHPIAQDMNMHESYAFGMDIDTAAKQLEEGSVLSPFKLDSITRQEGDSWVTYLPVSLGISLGLSALCIITYCLHSKGWLKVKVSKPDPDIEQGEHQDHENEQPETDFQKEIMNMRNTVAAILHEYATEARRTGTLPANLQPQPGQKQGNIYPTLHEVQVHDESHTTHM